MELQRWVLLENLLFEAKEESLREAKQLVANFPLEEIFILVADVANARPFSFKILGDFFQELGESKIRFWCNRFPMYLHKRGILQENNFETTPEPNMSIEEYENPLINDKMAFSVIKDDLETLLLWSASVNITTKTVNFEGKIISLLDLAAISGSLKIFKYLSVNGCEITKKTILCSVRGGNEDIIQMIENDNYSYNETLGEAIKYHRNHIALWIYENYINSEVLLTDCVKWRNTEFILFFLDNGRNIDECDLHRRTPLSHAAHDGLFTLAKYFVDHGANMNSRDRYGQTPLLHAKLTNHELLYNYLKSKGARSF